uniref:Reverse transcriptase Ty1/copia-type domain-containing protein n=1 Tax=Solanum lycopersicum TaxID=4081 RepID=A0A3Q7IH42_SOLLC
MHMSKPVSTPLASHFKLSKLQKHQSMDEVEHMSKVPYASAVGSIMYAMVWTRSDIAQSVSVVTRYMENPGKRHWKAIKWILRYFKGALDVGLTFRKSEGDGHVGGILGGAGGLPLALFAGVADALGSADALGAADGLPLDLFAGLGDALGAAADGLPLDLFAGPGDALGATRGFPLELFVECSPSKSDSTLPESRSSTSSNIGFPIVTASEVEGDLGGAVIVEGFLVE